MIENPQLPRGIPTTTGRVRVGVADDHLLTLHDADGVVLRERLDAPLAQTRGASSEAARRAVIDRVTLLRALCRRDRP